MNEKVEKLQKNKGFEEYKIIDELKPGLRSFNIKVKCISKNEEKKVVSKGTGEILRVTEALVGDSTGCIYLTLWNDDIDKIEIDCNYILTSVYTKVFRGSLKLNIGRFGSFKDINSEQIQEANTKNNLSTKIYAEHKRNRSGRKHGDIRFTSGQGLSRKPNKWIRNNYS